MSIRLVWFFSQSRRQRSVSSEKRPGLPFFLIYFAFELDHSHGRMNSVLWLILAVLAFSGVVLLPRLQVRSRRLFLLRVLFPSWRFFETIGVVPRLEVRTRNADGEWQPWQRALRPPRRDWSTVVFNPAGNLHFARQSAVEHLVSEAEAHEGPPEWLTSSSSYRIVQTLAKEVASGGEWFQFKIVQVDTDGTQEDFLVSAEMSVAGVSR